MAISIDRLDHEVWVLTVAEIDSLADRLYSRGVSTLSASSASERCDLVNASRALRRLLAAYERGTGHQLSAIMLGGQA
jgi:hypothetical protein